VDVDSRGLVGDRWYAVRDTAGKFGSGKNTRRFRRMSGLLRLGSRYVGETPQLLDPNGEPVADTVAFLHSYLERTDVELAREDGVPHLDQLPLSVLTTATLDWVRAAVPSVAVDERRFRPNLLIRTPPGTRPFVEDDWIGRPARIGPHVRVEFVGSSERCVMVNEEQPGLPHSPLVLRAVARSHDNRLDALATIAHPGTVRVGDTLTLD
jgi:uncharacterized protein YcbX